MAFIGHEFTRSTHLSHCSLTRILSFVLAFCLTRQSAVAVFLKPYNDATSGYSQVANSGANVVKLTLPQPAVPYSVTSVVAYSGRGTPQGSFSSGTTVKVHVLDKDAHSIFVSDNFDLGGSTDSFVFREFTINPVLVSDSFYIGLQPTGASQFVFALAFDFPQGNNFGRSFRYQISNGSLTTLTDDLMIGANVNALQIPGDYNGNGRVDGTDYVMWRKNPAAFGGSPAGYNVWRTNFGATAASGSFADSSVPEPATLPIIALALSIGLLSRRARS